MTSTCISRKYSIKEYIVILNRAIYSLIKYRKELKKISKEFQTNIMLAVTEVNGCDLCSYVHTKHAIDSGISNEELQSLLTGDHSNVKPEEAQALLFAQHYASVKGKYSLETYNNIVDSYGKDISLGILGNIKLISFGNAYGINWGNFKNRFKRKRIKGSKLINELFILLSPIVLIPILTIINLFRRK